MLHVIRKDLTVTESQKYDANRFNSRRQATIDQILELTKFAALSSSDDDVNIHNLLSQSLTSVQLPSGCPAELQHIQRLFHVYVHFGLYVQVALTKQTCTRKCVQNMLEPVFKQCTTGLQQWVKELLRCRTDSQLGLCF